MHRINEQKYRNFKAFMQKNLERTNQGAGEGRIEAINSGVGYSIYHRAL